jgi:tetratricopeptide (TPR) repeat protein
MCEWGQAHALGPNINHPERTHLEAALVHTRRAVALAANVTPREQALIRAQALRFGLDADRPPATDPRVEPPAAICVSRPPTTETDPLDFAYAQEMGRIAAQFPDDLDIALLHAEALLLLAPWDWWSKAGAPREGTLAAIEVLQKILARALAHPGANHYLIHAYEGSPTPERALAAAERLGALVPIAGHLVHMPAHIFMRVGRYADATRANQAAIDADDRLAAQLRAQGFAPLGHMSHHQHFLWSSASLQGRADLALGAARALAEAAARPERPFGTEGSNDYFLVLPLFAQVRFSRWDEILAAPEPRGDTVYPRAVRHWARGIALARSGNATDAQKELAALDRALDDPSLPGKTWKGIDDLAALLAIAQASLRGEIALARRQFDSAVDALHSAVELEDALEAEEPPPWAFPARHELGAALLLAGRAREAERVFRDDLKHHPANGWALYGLAESLRRQGRRKEGEAVARQFAEAWKAADTVRPDLRY